MVSTDIHFVLFLLSSMDLIPETVSRLNEVLNSYIFDEEPEFNGTFLLNIDVFKDIGSRNDRFKRFIEREIGLIKIINNYSTERLQVVTNSFSNNEDKTNESRIDYKSIRRSITKTDQVIKNQLFTLFYQAIIELENSRNDEQKNRYKTAQECSHQ